MVFFSFIVLFGLLMFLSHNAHYLTLLLSIEMVLLGVLSILVLCNKEMLPSPFFFLMMMACMGGFSVSMLVSLFRGVGKSFFML